MSRLRNYAPRNVRIPHHDTQELLRQSYADAVFSQIRYVGMSRRCHPHEFWSVNLPLRVLVEGIMDAEVSSRIGAEYGERSPERVTQRNGCCLPNAVVWMSTAKHAGMECHKGSVHPIKVWDLCLYLSH